MRGTNHREGNMDGCIFCDIVKGVIPNFTVYEDDVVLAFEDINPISEGHTLIIPKRHAENIWEIPEKDLAAVTLAAKKVAYGIQEALNPAGVVALQLNGRGVNQVVMHYHLHLMPKKVGTGDLPVSAWTPLEMGMDEIKQTADRIAAAIR